MGAFADEPLHELDLNSLPGPQETECSSAAKATALLARIDTLGCHRSYTVREMRPEGQYVVLEADWYEFRSQLDRLATSLVQVTKTANGTAVLVWSARPQEDETPGSWRWLRIRLNRLVTPCELNLSLPHRLSADSRSVILPQITFTELRREVLLNGRLLTCRRSELPPISAPPGAPLPVAAGPRQAGPQAALPQTQELHLTKAAVTYLIGPVGERIEATRLQSQATIKVLPICKRLSASEQSHPRSLQQTLAITGDRLQIATAMALLEAQLSLHRLAPDHQL
ncbi:hypothetical protein HG536_0D00580 [Torulaspora globosa]|uniref:K Homology domain-containing protein n=1 Tax=Torulaspora globosa TaxID=48254 RepID=A0A7G3ZGA0_9SACH|nr:uncharacterized protein HG536_0D00580 [Torulaspora globosa]QLL32536.1 hypothetical protein HG536_0D00580 [Torulaspora globosa]